MSSIFLQVAALQGHDFCLAQNAFSFQVDEQLLNTIKFHNITGQARDGQRHATEVVTVGGNLVGFGEQANFSRAVALTHATRRDEPSAGLYGF